MPYLPSIDPLNPSTLLSCPGLVIFYDPEKGYGYLRLEGTREEFHFRRVNLADGPVRKGDAVTFVLREGRSGWFADGVRVALL